VIDLSATLIGLTSFVLVVLTICGISYYKADSLQTWAEKTLRPKRDHRRQNMTLFDDDPVSKEVGYGTMET
jgi:hypothetical protein